MKTLVGFIGSPRIESSSKYLFDLFIRSFSGEIKIYNVFELKVSPCNACEGCYNSGVCVINDDMENIYQALDMCDYIVVASPIYFYGPPAPLKAVIDRCQCMWVRKFLLKKPQKKKKGTLITVGATKGENLFVPFYYITKVWFNSIEATLNNHIKIPEIEEKKDLSLRKDLLERVANEGFNFFREIE